MTEKYEKTEPEFPRILATVFTLNAGYDPLPSLPVADMWYQAHMSVMIA
jgi:hypothetical protein